MTRIVHLLITFFLAEVQTVTDRQTIFCPKTGENFAENRKICAKTDQPHRLKFCCLFLWKKKVLHHKMLSRVVPVVVQIEDKRGVEWQGAALAHLTLRSASAGLFAPGGACHASGVEP